jgi:hypothetical protein
MEGPKATDPWYSLEDSRTAKVAIVYGYLGGSSFFIS